MSAAFSALVRTSAFVRKEAVEVIRQPRLLVTLIIGPFLILFVFGAGLREVDPPFETLFVAPEDDAVAQEVRAFAEEQTTRLSVEGVTEDEGRALQRLRSGDLDMVVVFPEDVDETVRDNEQAVITLYHNQVDPIESHAILLYLEHAVSEVNRRFVARAVEEGQADSNALERHVQDARARVASAREASERGDDSLAALELARLRADTAALVLAAGPAALGAGPAAGPAGPGEDSLHGAVASFSERVDSIEDTDDFDTEADELDRELAVMEESLAEFRSLSPEVLASPFRGEVRRLAGENVQLGDFYAPAVVVVLLQHMLVTFVALSLVREAELGTNELYQVAPLRVGELLLGKYVAYSAIAALVSALLISALVFGLDVPMQGSLAVLVLVVALVMLASCGLGLCVAALARTDSQAVQYTMLVLLATVFFSGFTLSLDRFLPPFQWIGYVLPATYGVHLMRATMLHGQLQQPQALLVLALFAIALGTAGGLGVSRRFHQA